MVAMRRSTRISAWMEATQRARALTLEADSLLGPDPTSGTTLSVEWLASAAHWLAEVAPSWAEMTGRTPTERAYRRLFCAPSLEVWLICWPRGGHLQLHDHGGASGAFEVISGTLEERYLPCRPQPDGDLEESGPAARRRTVRTGRPVAFDGGYVHDVRNVAAPLATSGHVYGPAVRPMTFYHLRGGVLRTVELGEHQSLVEAEAAAESRAAVPAPDREAFWSTGPRGDREASSARTRGDRDVLSARKRGDCEPPSAGTRGDREASSAQTCGGRDASSARKPGDQEAASALPREDRVDPVRRVSAG
jgi:Cysteine dioxygenase type I